MSTHLISRRTEQVPIFQGDDAAAIEQARRDFNRVAAAEVRPPLRQGDPTPVQEAAEAYDAVVADALPRAVMATVRALGRRAYRHLRAAHPPREGNDGDRDLGFNEDTFLDALLEYFDAGEKTIAEPDFANRESLIAWLDDLNDGNFTQLAEAAVRVNEGGSPDPKDSLGSRVSRLYDVTSKSPATTD
jgi:hypothetical protein